MKTIFLTEDARQCRTIYDENGEGAAARNDDG